MKKEKEKEEEEEEEKEENLVGGSTVPATRSSGWQYDASNRSGGSSTLLATGLDVAVRCKRRVWVAVRCKRRVWVAIRCKRRVWVAVRCKRQVWSSSTMQATGLEVAVRCQRLVSGGSSTMPATGVGSGKENGKDLVWIRRRLYVESPR